MRLSNKGWWSLVALGVLGQANPVAAVDTREVIVQAQEDLAAVPPHVGHVLAAPNRTFSFDRANGHWMVARDFARVGVFYDRESYLKHPDNAFVETFFFDFDSDSPIDKEWITIAVADRIAKLKDRKGVTILLYGHADEAGSAAYNLTLSRQRALAVQAVLNAGGGLEVPIQIIARGKQDPASFVNQALNRRVEIVVRAPEQVRKALRASMQQEQARPPREVRPLGAPVGAQSKPNSQRSEGNNGISQTEPIGAQGTSRQPGVADQPSVRKSQPSATVDALRGGGTRQAPSATRAPGTPAADALQGQDMGADFYRSDQAAIGSDEFRADRNPLGLGGGPAVNPFLPTADRDISMGGR